MSVRDEKYSVSRVFALRNRLFEQVAGTFTDQVVSGPRFRLLLRVFADNLPTSVPIRAIEESVRDLAGQRLDRALLYDTCWRLAGNLPRLRRELAVTPWNAQPLPEWVPIQIENARRDRNAKKVLGCVYRMRVVAGTSCPLTISKFWTLRLLRFLSVDFGFSRPPRARANEPARYPFMAAEQFVLLRFFGLIDPAVCSHQDGPMFTRMYMPAAMLQWNKEQIKRRFRIDEGYSCPLDYAVDFPCHCCPHGYKTTCVAAVHPVEYLLKICPQCQEESPFDDFVSKQVCVVCANEHVHSDR